MELISPVFRMDSPIPRQYTGQGQNVNPPLNIFDVPAKAQGLTLIMHDPDAPGGDFLHWLVWDIPPSTEFIAVNNVPVGAFQGRNGAGEIGYMGPAPPAGKLHHYIFDLYALDTTINLESGSKLEDVMEAMQGHIISRTALTGTYAVEPS